jgi:anti-sigma-K factor RskA
MSARAQLSEYLLDELGAGERSRFEAELTRDRQLAAEVDRLRPVVTRLELLDPSVWDGGAEPPALPAREPAQPRRRRALVLRPVVAAVLAAGLLALGVAAGVLLADDGGGRDAAGTRIVLAPVEPLGAGAAGSVRFAGDEATVRLSGLAPSRDGSFYELWLLNSPTDLVSLGSFRVPASGAVDVSVPLPAATAGFSAFDVSVEPPDGDPAHSAKSVLRAPLASQ